MQTSCARGLTNIQDLAFLDELKLLDDEADEDLVRVQEAVVDSQVHQLCQQVQDTRLQVSAARDRVLL